jgi:nucleoside-triphosphatase
MVIGEKVLLTGRPGCGKTTLIKRVATTRTGRAAGFYTEEIRQAGTRVGFKLVTLDGKEAVIAHVDFKSSEHVGKYGLNLSGLEDVGVQALRDALRTRQAVIIDEIGPMEIRSQIFRKVVLEALYSSLTVLGTIAARPLPFIETIKARPDVRLVEVRRDNRDQLVSELSTELQS